LDLGQAIAELFLDRRQSDPDTAEAVEKKKCGYADHREDGVLLRR